MTGDGGASASRDRAGGSGSGHRAPSRRGRGLLVPALGFMALAVLVAVVGWAIFQRQAHDMRAQSADALLAVQKVQSAQISRWFADEMHDATLVASAQSVEEPLEQYVKSPGGPIPRQLRSALELFRGGHGIDRITVLDRKLEAVAWSPETPAGQKPSGLTPQESSVAAEALRRGAAAFSGVYRAPDGAEVMDFAAPLRDIGSPVDRVAGVIVLRELAATSLYPLLQSWPPSLPSGESVLVARRGSDAVLMDPRSLVGKAPLWSARPLTETSLPAVKAVLGRSGIAEGVDYRGQPVLAAMGKVGGTPWWLVAKQDLAAVDRPVKDRGWATFAWVVGLIVLAGVAVLLYLRWRETRTFAGARRAGAAAEPCRGAVLGADARGQGDRHPDGRRGPDRGGQRLRPRSLRLLSRRAHRPEHRRRPRRLGGPHARGARAWA